MFLLGVFAFSIYEPPGLSDRVNYALGWIAGVVVLGAIVTAVFFGQKEAAWKAASEMQVEIKDGRIVQARKAEPVVEMALSDIRAVRTWRGSLVVRGIGADRAIVIPRGVAGFEELKRQLATVCEISPLKIKLSPWFFLPFFLMISAFSLLFMSHARWVVAAAAFAILFLQGYSLYLIRGLLKEAPKRRMLVVTYILLFFCVLLVVYERFPVLK